MKNKLPTALCALIAAALVAFGLLYGTWSGYREDRARVDELLTMENGLLDVLSYRAADGLNLSVVAKRHLPAADEDLLALEQYGRKLQQAAEVRAFTSLDHAVAEAFEAVSARLKENASFQQSQRDQRYLDMLTADFNSLRASDVVAAYNQAAEEFNNRLDAPLSGDLATLLGIEKCPLYQ
ncbi:MAG: hypothetical protein IKU70_05815 [Clostridia bacterium]|nr:hypothetical protein [Clostridia bacterium]